MNVGKGVGEGERAFPKTYHYWLRTLSCCYHPCPSPLTPEVSKRPAWIVCNLSTDLRGVWGLLFFFTALMGGCGEIRTLALQLNHTKGSNKRDVDVSSPHATLVHQKQFTWNEPSSQQYHGCYTVKCNLKWITAGNQEAELKKREKKTTVSLPVWAEATPICS